MFDNELDNYEWERDHMVEQPDTEKPQSDAYDASDLFAVYPRKHDPANPEANWILGTPALGQVAIGIPREEFVFDDLVRGIGGAPTRATTLPTEAAERKAHPVASGVLDYFPDAIAAIAHVSWRGNEQHNPGQPLHWARGKSTDEADTMLRHFLQRGSLDTDGLRHSAKMAWRALALLQKEIEGEQK